MKIGKAIQRTMKALSEQRPVRFGGTLLLLLALGFGSVAAAAETDYAGSTDNSSRTRSRSVNRRSSGTPRSRNNRATDNYAPSHVQTQLRVNVDEGTREVHFVRDNTDPYVITKAYVLKHANPYAVRGYLVNAIKARKVDSSPVEVTALRYTDGTGIVLVSAEDYRFSDTAAGDGIDTLIRKLDRKELGFLHQMPTRIYFPKIQPATNLVDMLRKVGTTISDPEFATSPDSIMVDEELNAIVISGPEWSLKHSAEMLEQYDRPIPEVRIEYELLELYAENDDRLGVDFQSWKNNDGVDFFSAGAHVSRNWSTFYSGGVDNRGSNSIKYWNFNPKWNTRYLDFLTSIGKARIVTSGFITARNREVSKVSIRSGFFYDRTDYSYTEDQDEFNYTSPNPDIIPREALTSLLPETELLELLPSLTRGEYNWRMLGYLAADSKYDTTVGEKIEEQLEIINSSTSTQAEKQAAYVKLQEYLQEEGLTELLNYTYYNRNPLTGEKMDASLSNSDPGLIHGKIQYPMVANGFSFDMVVFPVVTGEGVSLELGMRSVSLLGWNSDGTTRSSDSKIKARFQMGYDGTGFVVGGLKKAEAVRGVTGLPFLKDLPYIGLLFTTENESIKKSQLVLIARATCSKPEMPQDPEVSENIGKILKGVNKGLESPVGNVFYQQHWVDTDKWE